ncbi:WXG100 family type VII secretion target [Aeromicrobium fastidiosum]|uniref:WXG100 family type VII secretion target n=1 Tax=Aeromicrobium fastidiosum TaxID=52699 RepID=A0A641AJ05_9ACTN|nr:hypothetical protein [Aeromicrobium fastidiosum]KAA1374678.1 hypothetical protein ESP62_014900 [Aeromicrobium fastidiosum]MBP2390775.1 uncharacterized protein YukE [Aeromicrobium fastidiosum]
MADMIGADVEALRRLALQFEQSAQRLRAVSGSVSNSVRASAWVGPVSVRFRTSWDSDHSVRLKTVATTLEGNARILRQNAAAQEAASASLAGVGSRPATGTGVDSLDPEQVRAIEKLMRTWALENPGLALEVTKVLKEGGYPNADRLLPRLRDVKGMLNGLELAGPISGLAKSLKTPGGVLGFLSAGFSAKDLGEALGVGDEPAAWRAGTDMAAYVLTAGVPGGGVAWWFGTKVGEAGYAAADQAFNVTDANFASGVRTVFGSGVDPNNLTVEQADAMVRRYDGPMGIVNSIGDAGMAPIYGAGDAVGNAVYDASEAAGRVAHDTGEAVGRAVDDTGKKIGGVIDSVKKVKWPWQ